MTFTREALCSVEKSVRITEEQLYAVLCSLRECKSGATSGQHMLEALAFFDSTAGFALIDLRNTVSGRCKGVARDMYLGKDPLRQKHPLQVVHVKLCRFCTCTFCV